MKDAIMHGFSMYSDCYSKVNKNSSDAELCAAIAEQINENEVTIDYAYSSIYVVNSENNSNEFYCKFCGMKDLIKSINTAEFATANSVIENDINYEDVYESSI